MHTAMSGLETREPWLTELAHLHPQAWIPTSPLLLFQPGQMAEKGSLLPLLRKLFSQHLLLKDAEGSDKIVLIGTKIPGMPGQSNNVFNSTI